MCNLFRYSRKLSASTFLVLPVLLFTILLCKNISANPINIENRLIGKDNINSGSNNTKLIETPVYGSSRIGMAQYNPDRTPGKYVYELTDHLGNVRAVVSKDGSDAGADIDILSATDYYPGGMRLPNRWYVSENYRFGYQGQFAEKDPETGYNQFELRLYDARIGRWMSPDPYGQYCSPYLAMGNNPVMFLDPSGGWGRQQYIRDAMQYGGYTRAEARANWNSFGGNYHYNGLFEGFEFKDGATLKGSIQIMISDKNGDWSLNPNHPVYQNSLENFLFASVRRLKNLGDNELADKQTRWVESEKGSKYLGIPGRLILSLNPIWTCTNGGKGLFTDTDGFGNNTNTFADKLFATGDMITGAVGLSTPRLQLITPYSALSTLNTEGLFNSIKTSKTK